jgi:hypothetical protein
VTYAQVRSGSSSLNDTKAVTVTKFRSQADMFDSAYASSSLVCAGSTPAAPDANTTGT